MLLLVMAARGTAALQAVSGTAAGDDLGNLAAGIEAASEIYAKDVLQFRRLIRIPTACVSINTRQRRGRPWRRDRARDSNFSG